MKLYYLYHDTVRRAHNDAGYDYTPAYFPALLAYMGVTAEPITSCELDRLASEDILLVGAERIDTLPACRVILLGSGVGTDVIPSVREKRVFAEYLTANGVELPLFVPLHAPCLEGIPLAFARTEDGEQRCALLQSGRVHIFCFDLLGSVWFSGDGYLPTPPPNYFSVLRTPDLRPLPDGYSHDVPFNDLLVAELERILWELGAAHLYRLPPTEDGGVPDLAFHFSGDDDCNSMEINRAAAQKMKELGLPYHINAMSWTGEGFVFDRAGYRELCSYGCEIALHLNFVCDFSYSRADMRTQCELFERTFGVKTKTAVNHCLVQGGSTAERLRWLSEEGILADNGKHGEFDPKDINAFDVCGYGFGTAFPRFGCDDAAHGNVPLLTAEIPITYYEVRLWSEDASTDKIIRYLDDGAAHGRILQYFMHPHYLTDGWPKDRAAELRAIEVTRRHLAHKGYAVHYTTTDRIADFWQARRNARICVCGKELEVTVACPMLLCLPCDWIQAQVCVDGARIAPVEKTVMGAHLRLVPLSAGTHRVTREN